MTNLDSLRPQVEREARERLLNVAQVCRNHGQPELAAAIEVGALSGEPNPAAADIVQATILHPQYGVPDVPTGWVVGFIDEAGNCFGAWTYVPQGGDA